METETYTPPASILETADEAPQALVATGDIDDQRDEAGLFTAFAALADAGEAGRFLRDIASPSEIKSFEERWRIARLLDEGALSYRAIAKRTGASTTTVARVARFLKEESNNGYRVMIDRLRNK
ncbi:MAG: YerC/YecD family TrpR-related protein [Pseudomonadota bacterium]